MLCIDSNDYLVPGDKYTFTCPASNAQCVMIVPNVPEEAYEMEVECEPGDVPATLA